MTLLKTTMLPLLPIETWGKICKAPGLDRRDLYHLVRSCRLLDQFVKPILYRRVRLLGYLTSTMDTLELLCRDPSLAASVHSLSLHGNGYGGSILPRLFEALLAMTSLTRVQVFCQVFTTYEDQSRFFELVAEHGNIRELVLESGVPDFAPPVLSTFRLSTLSVSPPNPDRTTLLLMQSSLEHLVHLTLPHWFYVKSAWGHMYEAWLPRLETLSVATALDWKDNLMLSVEDILFILRHSDTVKEVIYFWFIDVSMVSNDARCHVTYLHNGARDIENDLPSLGGLSIQKMDTRLEIACTVAAYNGGLLHESLEELCLEYVNDHHRDSNGLVSWLRMFFCTRLADRGFCLESLNTLKCRFQHPDDNSPIEPEQYSRDVLTILPFIADVCADGLVTLTGLIPPVRILAHEIGTQLTRFPLLHTLGIYDSTVGSRNEEEVIRYALELKEDCPQLHEMEIACYDEYKKPPEFCPFLTVQLIHTSPIVERNHVVPCSMYRHCREVHKVSDSDSDSDFDYNFDSD